MKERGGPEKGRLFLLAKARVLERKISFLFDNRMVMFLKTLFPYRGAW
jgi:hypothetical protein